MKKKATYFNRILEHISLCMMPIIPALIAGGLMKLVILLLGYTDFFVLFPDTETILGAISNASFYFLPIMVAYTAAKHFNADIISAMASAGTFLLPEFIALMAQEGVVDFAGVPVYKMTYAYTVFPIIVLVYLMSVLERNLLKLLKGVWRDLFLRLLIIFITSIVGMLLIGPAVGIVSRCVLESIRWMQINMPIMAWAVFAATAPFQIITGIHWIFVSLIIQDLGTYGVESGFMVGYFMLTMSLTAITFVTLWKCKDEKRKNTAITALITIFFTGTSEPALYGICLIDKTALWASVAAGAVGGIYQGIVNIQTYVYAFPTVFSILIFQNRKDSGNLIQAVIAGSLSFATAFAIMLFKYRKKHIKNVNIKNNE